MAREIQRMRWFFAFTFLAAGRLLRAAAMVPWSDWVEDVLPRWVGGLVPPPALPGPVPRPTIFTPATMAGVVVGFLIADLPALKYSSAVRASAGRSSMSRLMSHITQSASHTGRSGRTSTMCLT